MARSIRISSRGPATLLLVCTSCAAGFFAMNAASFAANASRSAGRAGHRVGDRRRAGVLRADRADVRARRQIAELLRRGDDLVLFMPLVVVEVNAHFGHLAADDVAETVAAAPDRRRDGAHASHLRERVREPPRRRGGYVDRRAGGILHRDDRLAPLRVRLELARNDGRPADAGTNRRPIARITSANEPKKTNERPAASRAAASSRDSRP